MHAVHILIIKYYNTDIYIYIYPSPLVSSHYYWLYSRPGKVTLALEHLHSRGIVFRDLKCPGDGDFDQNWKIKSMGPKMDSLWSWVNFRIHFGQWFWHRRLARRLQSLAWTTSKSLAPNGYGSIPIDTFLVGWTSIYQLFWGSLGTRVLTHPQIIGSKCAKGVCTE